MPLPDEFIVYGSEEMLKPLILQLLAQHYSTQGIETTGGGTVRNHIPVDFDDWLGVTMIWRGKVAATGKNHTVEKSVRLVGKDPKTFSLNSLQALGQRVLTKFNNLNFITGYIKVKYAKWKDGIHTWGYFQTAEMGYQIIEAMGDIVDKPIDRKRVRVETVLDPAGAFDPTPDKITLSYKQVRPNAVAPIAEMKFYGAKVTFPWIGHTEQLCNISGYLIRDLSFLDAYED